MTIRGSSVTHGYRLARKPMFNARQIILYRHQACVESGDGASLERAAVEPLGRRREVPKPGSDRQVPSGRRRKGAARARSRLDGQDIVYTSHVEVGDVAQTIARYARELHCDQVIMGTRGLGSGGVAAISGLLLGSIATKVLHLVEVPVTLVK